MNSGNLWKKLTIKYEFGAGLVSTKLPLNNIQGNATVFAPSELLSIKSSTNLKGSVKIFTCAWGQKETVIK